MADFQNILAALLSPDNDMRTRAEVSNSQSPKLLVMFNSSEVHHVHLFTIICTSMWSYESGGHSRSA